MGERGRVGTGSWISWPYLCLPSWFLRFLEHWPKERSCPFQEFHKRSYFVGSRMTRSSSSGLRSQLGEEGSAPPVIYKCGLISLGDLGKSFIGITTISCNLSSGCVFTISLVVCSHWVQGFWRGALEDGKTFRIQMNEAACYAPQATRSHNHFIVTTNRKCPLPESNYPAESW